jgi:catechol 2,3-dioxygenase-like lactoylglutathione lyase family enzyme
MKQQKSDARISRVTMNLEVHVIPVSAVERSKEFYQRLGWRLDDDAAPAKDVRIVQFTPGLGVLDHLRQGSHCGSARLGRGGTDCLRHHSGS